MAGIPPMMTRGDNFVGEVPVDSGKSRKRTSLGGVVGGVASGAAELDSFSLLLSFALVGDGAT